MLRGILVHRSLDMLLREHAPAYSPIPLPVSVESLFVPGLLGFSSKSANDLTTQEYL